MSSVLRPVGPEPRERYWVRRLAVLVAVIVAIGVVIALVGNAVSAGSAVQADPAPPSVTAPTLPATPSASPTPDASTLTPGTVTASPSTSASPTPGDVATPDPGQTPKAEKSTPPTSTDKKLAEQQAAEKKAAADKKAKSLTLAICPASDVRSTLTGPKTVEAAKSATFALSLTNGSATSCYVKVTGANFTLTVVSGRDRIWSSTDCAATAPTQSRKLAADESVGWKVTWNGRRSAPGCKNSSEKPKPGYYWAIASFDDAKAVRSRIILT